MSTFPFQGALPEMIGMAAGPLPCKIDDECPGGMYCAAFGKCIADSCNASQQCGPVRVCFGGICLLPDQVPPGSECTGDAQCNTDRMCAGGYCIRRAQHIKIPAGTFGGPNPADPGWGTKKTDYFVGGDPSQGAANHPKPLAVNYPAAALAAAAVGTFGYAVSTVMTTKTSGRVASGLAWGALGALIGSQL